MKSILPKKENEEILVIKKFLSSDSCDEKSNYWTDLKSDASLFCSMVALGMVGPSNHRTWKAIEE